MNPRKSGLFKVIQTEKGDVESWNGGTVESDSHRFNAFNAFNGLTRLCPNPGKSKVRGPESKLIQPNPGKSKLKIEVGFRAVGGAEAVLGAPIRVHPAKSGLLDGRSLRFAQLALRLKWRHEFGFMGTLSSRPPAPIAPIAGFASVGL
jgi:hypothetical protein